MVTQEMKMMGVLDLLEQRSDGTNVYLSVGHIHEDPLRRFISECMRVDMDKIVIYTPSQKLTSDDSGCIVS